MTRARHGSAFRPRLTVAFVLVVGISCGILAITTYALSRSYRLHSFHERATGEAALITAMMPRPLTPPTADRIAALFGRDHPLDVVLVAGGKATSSSPRISAADVPSRVQQGDGGATADVAGARYEVLPAHVGDADVYYFFPEADLLGGLDQLRNLLAVGWLAVVFGATLVGGRIARTTLAPVRAASTAAQALAEGLLETRLPVEGDDEFGRWARYFNEMASVLGDKIAALSAARDREVQFTADVAHELRTPLAAAVNAAAVLQARIDEIPAEVRRPVELVLADVGRLRSLVLDLLELSRLDSGRGEVATEVLSLPAVVESVCRSCGWIDDVTLELDPAWVKADRLRVDRVVTNLISNAVLHGGTNVTVSTGRVDGFGTVEVHDDGPGIPVAEQQVIFDRFYKADTSRSSGGSGLGLAIALENTQVMGGAIVLESDDDRGTSFTVCLPAAGAAER